MAEDLDTRSDGRSNSNSAVPQIPLAASLADLRSLAAGCKNCPLWEIGTQTVFGEGSETARAMLIGEAPGEMEDRAGRPFVGPAGQVLDRALAGAGIDRTRVYITNLVKHFPWQPRGQRRIPRKPAAREIAACRPWLAAEIDRLRPAVIVCLGATAAQALLGRAFLVTRRRGELLSDVGYAAHVMATVHPSSILRIPDAASREQALTRFTDDLRRVADLL